jgi:hypothetical protein
MDNYNLEDMKKLFEVAYNFMMKSCGDGWSLIVSKNYMELADVFEKHMQEMLGDNGFARDNYLEHGYITFSRSPEESITFARSMDIDALDFYEFVAII